MSENYTRAEAKEKMLEASKSLDASFLKFANAILCKARLQSGYEGHCYVPYIDGERTMVMDSETDWWPSCRQCWNGFYIDDYSSSPTGWKAICNKCSVSFYATNIKVDDTIKDSRLDALLGSSSGSKDSANEAMSPDYALLASMSESIQRATILRGLFKPNPVLLFPSEAASASASSYSSTGPSHPQRSKPLRFCSSFRCLADNPPSQCIACKRVFYCNADCQRLDWPRHKLDCKQYASSAGKKKSIKQ
jgi:hypothetical protein